MPQNIYTFSLDTAFPNILYSRGTKWKEKTNIYKEKSHTIFGRGRTAYSEDKNSKENSYKRTISFFLSFF